MRTILSLVLGLLMACVMLPQDASPAGKTSKPQSEKMQIGISRTLFGGVSDRLALALLTPFSSLMESETGISGALSVSDDPFKLAKQLKENDMHIGVFEGIEFAWVHKQQPRLQPLVISVNQERALRACLVVRASSKSSFDDLKHKTLALPECGRLHNRLFLERLCREHGRLPLERFFTQITKPQYVEEALDDVVDRKADVTVVDNVSLQGYKRQKPGRFAHLHVIGQSEEFPASVVVFCRDQFDKATLESFRDGLLNAHKNPTGRHLLTMWKLTAFEAVPDNYEKTMQNIARSYPAPDTSETP